MFPTTLSKSKNLRWVYFVPIILLFGSCFCCSFKKKILGMKLWLFGSKSKRCGRRSGFLFGAGRYLFRGELFNFGEVCVETGWNHQKWRVGGSCKEICQFFGIPGSLEILSGGDWHPGWGSIPGYFFLALSEEMIQTRMTAIQQLGVRMHRSAWKCANAHGNYTYHTLFM